MSADVVSRMISYFARHEVDKQATGFNAGEDGFPSAGRVAWDAWGGDAGQSWVNGLNNQVASVRAIEGAIGISDFDDTLYVSGGLNQRVYDFIDSQDVDLVVVTGRHEADREATVALLDKLGVEYKDLVMQPEDVLKALGLPLIAHTGLPSVQLQNPAQVPAGSYETGK